MNEYDLIKRIAGNFPRCQMQLNDFFTSDAEMVQIGDQIWGLTIDEFTPEEDLFTSDDPKLLGANLAVATLSDLLAVGVEAQFFMHAVSLPKNTDAIFIDGLSSGIQSVLTKAGCFLCGGDIGTAETWRFCGFAMGYAPGNKFLTRNLPDEKQSLWITGHLGDANLAAFQSSVTPRFELRLDEAKLIRACATACIDTSGGFFDAVWILHSLNPQLCIDIFADKFPLIPAVKKFTATSEIPAEAILLGGAGEYELLFASPENLPDSVRLELLNLGATQIGRIHPHSEPRLNIWRNNEIISVMSEPPPCPRKAASIDVHIQDVIEMARTLFGPAQGRSKG
ncbi:thiamine-monophosphate kinase [Planctomycetota bacterium]